MAQPFQLPYFRDSKELPAPLPSVDEIHSSPNILKGLEAWADRKVVRVGEHFIAKYSPYNDQIEGENLLFIEQNLQISAPRLYAMWKEPDGRLYIVMEYLQGDTLQFLWPNLQESDKVLILSKLRAIFNQVRTLQSPGFFGGINKSHMPHHLFYSPAYDPKISGPFGSESDLVLGLISKSRLNAEDRKRHSYLADFFENQLLLDLVEEDRTSTFTHSDLQMKNILVREISSQELSQGKDYDVSIVDWESAGWYPSYWEYVAAFFAFTWDSDWSNRVADIVDAWPAEAAMMKMIYQDLWL
ncbi:hypothetical protein VC83_09000 [Pseudogymnoascus destructans]|uniref:Aminoglycoside phosphotransferase domain-containing protein n=2 Tax=Pseudogymnoascus destructans TaxID=655981 RepID=L8G1K2_PSED2|nr:uncharacterized protein VC83_09000 [Pseudogymnoascus destructans]ELR05846.1 hypothetical protein GMDG_07619 [Pseudogymnoascus destructans 20631-21]OAF54485.1 hypothetical protein VC83_09000 [Pseudogymnoascus destructans]